MLDNLRKSEGRVKEPFPRESRKGKTSSKQSGKLEYFLMYSLCHVFFRDLRNLLWTKTTVFKEKKHSGKPWNYTPHFEKNPLFSLNADINFLNLRTSAITDMVFFSTH